MAPRRYDMSGKRAAAAEMRRKIVEATLKLHGERGIFGTAWTDIAREADVALGTVYRYFPSLDELVPACGELLMERTQPPQPEDIGAIIGGATLPSARLKKVADALCAFYARGGRFLESDLRERELAAVREWEEHLRSMVKGFVEEALKDAQVPAKTVAQVCFLFDVPTFAAMRVRGLNPDEAASLVTEMAMAWLGFAANSFGSGENKTRGGKQ